MAKPKSSEWLFKKWNFYMGDFSFKRIYRNSEGHIIPLLGGVLALAIFYSINTLIYTYVTENNETINTLMYMHATENNKNRLLALWSLGVFIIVLLVAWFVIYQLKKANLREDIAKILEKMLIKHYEPYIYKKDLGETENKDFYYLVYFNANRVSNSLEKYIIHNKIKSLLNKKEILYLAERIIKDIGLFVEEQMEKMPIAVKVQFRRQSGVRLFQMIKNNKAQNYDFLMILKEGNKNNPKNLVSFEVDIEENKPPFVVLENLKSRKEEQKFLDINARQISYVEYQRDRVRLTITQPNASPRKIVVSLSEWLANRNDLR